ncbi:hypothetical protein PR202_ga10513 [Eleusine coracana subsp. coracana]|uniref:Trichome birefringence-like N-terminal domain-containing protein n=1 Tax=Eleusine coracana subsp. coracana TaxID=191504 RepID=A0AAV5C718_ELECO|nr:hypothetical protein PR202_ga10513 [Eleusine coracana subsp. coracana]
MEAANKPAVTKKWAVAASLCSLAGLFLLSGALVVGVGYSPFQGRAAPWDRFSTVQKTAPAAPRAAPPPPPAAAGGRRHHSAVIAPAPDLDGGDRGDEGEDAVAGLAPAPAPAAEEDEGECDLFNGDWVRDDDEAWYPLYEAAECPFLSDQVACRRNGRPDSGYEQWRWRPRGCAGRTRMGGAEALELCRDKRLVFVGDSLNRNMWESLACILYAAVPDRSRTRIVENAGAEIFRAMDYNCSVEFFWSPFLVNLETKSNGTRALKLDRLPPMLQRTLGADVLVYNTGHWWTHTGKLRAWDHLEKDGKKVEMSGEEAFNRALRTWAKWIDHNVDQGRTRVFFRNVSPEHKW